MSEAKALMEDALNTLKATMDKSIEKVTLIIYIILILGDKMTKNIPSLRLKKWNTTRWLGRAACLTALCHAYPYILKHLQEEMKSAKDDIKTLAMNLYQQLIRQETHSHPRIVFSRRARSKIGKNKFQLVSL